jgi:phosphoglucosamine mutase
VNVKLESRADVIGAPAVKGRGRGRESELAGKGRVLLRPSGTSPSCA